MTQPLFEGLVYDEDGNPVEVRRVGNEPCYVVYDAWGMAYHIPTAQVDRQVLEFFRQITQGHEEELAKATARFIGQEDPFTLAILQTQFRNWEQHMEELLRIGLPEDARYLLGMMGFHVIINHHGEVVSIHLPQREMEEPPDPEL